MRVFQLDAYLYQVACSRELSMSRSFTHPSTVSALRADPPSPTRGEGRTALTLSLRTPRP
ncbi:MAG: hypothetical protein EOS30_29260 [Mesorhizobium sp.]|nr:MAG: hypothetical protein EOS30_29260 [Mesorhizobium sp.]